MRHLEELLLEDRQLLPARWLGMMAARRSSLTGKTPTHGMVDPHTSGNNSITLTLFCRTISLLLFHRLP